MYVDLGYVGYNAPNLSVFVPHKSELSKEQKQQNTQHAKERVCNEHTMKGIKRLRIVQDPLRLSAYTWADSLFINASGLHNFRVMSPLRAYTRTSTHVKKLKFN